MPRSGTGDWRAAQAALARIHARQLAQPRRVTRGDLVTALERVEGHAGEWGLVLEAAGSYVGRNVGAALEGAH